MATKRKQRVGSYPAEPGTPAALLNMRARQVIVHSVLYYELDHSLVTDHTFDRWCVELAELLEKHQELARQHPFWVDLKDFDPSTGFNFAKHPWGLAVARRLLAPPRAP